MGKPCYTASPL